MSVQDTPWNRAWFTSDFNFFFTLALFFAWKFCLRSILPRTVVHFFHIHENNGVDIPCIDVISASFTPFWQPMQIMLEGGLIRKRSAEPKVKPTLSKEHSHWLSKGPQKMPNACQFSIGAWFTKLPFSLHGAFLYDQFCLELCYIFFPSPSLSLKTFWLKPYSAFFHHMILLIQLCWEDWMK